MTSLPTAALVAATFTSGLSAGLFYSYFFSVMPGLRASDDRTFVVAMQWINVKILNGWFAVAFAGAPLFSVLASVLLLVDGAPAGTGLAVGGTALNLLTVVVTFVWNVPLNNALMRAGEPDHIGDVAGARRRFEVPWVRWNNVRTATSVAGFAALVGAMVQYGG